MISNCFVKGILWCTMGVICMAGCESRDAKPWVAPGIDTSSPMILTISPERGDRKYTSIVNGIVAFDPRRQLAITSRVTGRIERLYVKYNYQQVKKGMLLVEMYSPDLVAAQQELISLDNNRQDLVLSAKQRLQKLGMHAAAITQLLKTKKVQYRVPIYSECNGYILEPPNGMIMEGQYVNATTTLFSIYQKGQPIATFDFPPELAARIAKGDILKVSVAHDTVTKLIGTIEFIFPTQKIEQHFTSARVMLNRDIFSVGQLLKGQIEITYHDGWWLPATAVMNLGTKSIVFRQQGDEYIPTTVITGIRINSMVQVISNIGSWKVSANAAFIKDNEHLIKTDE